MSETYTNRDTGPISIILKIDGKATGTITIFEGFNIAKPVTLAFRCGKDRDWEDVLELENSAFCFGTGYINCAKVDHEMNELNIISERLNCDTQSY